jgi:hypothetical protein
MNGWMTVVAQCQECTHVFATCVPESYDGSPILCAFCGELDATASIYKPAEWPRIDAANLTHIEHHPHVGKPVKSKRSRIRKMRKNGSV